MILGALRVCSLKKKSDLRTNLTVRLTGLDICTFVHLGKYGKNRIEQDEEENSKNSGEVVMEEKGENGVVMLLMINMLVLVIQDSIDVY